MSWESADPKVGILVYDENIITFDVGQGYCYINGTSGYGSGLQVNITKVQAGETGDTESVYTTNSLGTPGIGYEFKGAALGYRDPDNPENPSIRAGSIGDGYY